MKSFKEYLIEDKEPKKYVDAIIVFNEEILVLRRANYMKQFRSMWGFPGGSIDKNDKDAKEAIIREIKEETKIELSNNEINNLKSIDIHEHLGGPNDDIVVSSTEYFLVHLEKEREIKISREHSKYEWVNKDNFKDKQGKYVSDVYHYIDLYYEGQL